MADWFAQNAPAAQAPPSGNWFSQNAPKAAAEEPKSNLQRFAQSWWDHSVLKHPIDSAVGIVKSLVTMPDYHTLTPEEKGQVDSQVEKAFHEAAHPTPELAGQVASTGTNAALITGATMGLAKGLGAVVDNADVLKGAARGAKNAVTETAHYKGLEIPGGNVMAGSAGGSIAAHAVGLPGELGAVVGGAAPIIKGAVKGGRAALAARIAKAAAEDKILSPELATTMLEDLNAGEEAAAAHQAAAAPLRTSSIPANAMPDYGHLMEQNTPPQWQPGPAGTPEPWAPFGHEPRPARPPAASAPVAASPAAAATVAEEVPAVQHKTDLEDLLERSLKDPVIARTAISELDEHLKAEGLKKAGEIIDKNQVKRALKLGRFLQDYGITPEHIEAMSTEQWHQVGELADVLKPSATTIQKTKDLLNMAAENAPKVNTAAAGAGQ